MVQKSPVDQIEKIPFFPIIFFKNKKILIDNIDFQKLFKSSGTVLGDQVIKLLNEIEQFTIEFENDSIFNYISLKWDLTKVMIPFK